MNENIADAKIKKKIKNRKKDSNGRAVLFV